MTQASHHTQRTLRMELLNQLKQAGEDGRAERLDLMARFFGLDETSRYSIVNSLAAVANDVSRSLLIEVLRRDASPLVRHEAAFALGCVGDCVSRIVLREALAHDSSFLVRHESAMALSELGTLEDISALEAGLRDPSSEVVISCEVALHKIIERFEMLAASDQSTD